MAAAIAPGTDALLGWSADAFALPRQEGLGDIWGGAVDVIYPPTEQMKELHSCFSQQLEFLAREISCGSADQWSSTRLQCEIDVLDLLFDICVLVQARSLVGQVFLDDFVDVAMERRDETFRIAVSSTSEHFRKRADGGYRCGVVGHLAWARSDLATELPVDSTALKLGTLGYDGSVSTKSMASATGGTILIRAAPPADPLITKDERDRLKNGDASHPPIDGLPRVESTDFPLYRSFRKVLKQADTTTDGLSPQATSFCQELVKRGYRRSNVRASLLRHKRLCSLGLFTFR
jgi:hypothetical protein